MSTIILILMEITGNQKETTRSQRRRAGTRARIVETAKWLMRERGVEAVTIHDITEAADVGHGTFYLHFNEKADVLQPVIGHLADSLHERVNQVTGGAEDPALRLATGIRIALHCIVSDPLWNWFVFRSGTSLSRHGGAKQYAARSGHETGCGKWAVQERGSEHDMELRGWCDDWCAQ
ncbi:MAG: TetR/AcrR family transcriptional regulator [Pseudomonadales bacterium]|jgi:AcrR family transcriptional regulator|nr:TetR/AcrR family transcriptional regulator [Pseudomonadales bacterium]MDP6473056.1 TetR/AcrR family transcriptional regulator [Pseudomonadales bacterium]MDP6826187.1 TetR/AcrR family transcriptional regulator [Pseudomonadales bacterium]MDP6973436.1 TetR/AcrR family transcriptional regulator [Pseudomonadales bacterium]|tara:strand:- start:1008 stop:1541 length:534 start_codon:yes stop_codon:yes gene_type:complete